MLKPETIHNIEIVLARYGNSFDLGKASDREKLAIEKITITTNVYRK